MIALRQEPKRWWWALLLVALPIVAYRPAWHAGFVWDDDRWVTRNPLVSAPDGLYRIWFSTDSPSQYFPLVTTTFRFEHALWGLSASGYHGLNILLHAINALLVWRLLARLRVPGAWFAAAVFALHPVNVESVAWVSELKNVQSLFFSLIALLAWATFVARTWRAGFPDPAVADSRGEVTPIHHSVFHSATARSGDPALQLSPRAPWVWYGLALVAYFAALLSKSTACTLPVALFAVLWLKRDRIGWRRIAHIVPFVVLGAGMALLTMWWERYHQGTAGKAFAFGPLDRVLIASRAIWFYLGKLLWPVDLSFAYSPWKIDPANPLAYGWVLACALAVGALIALRHRFGRSIGVATLFYVGTLAPLLGLVMLWTFQYKFVADHYQYVASIGPIAAIAAGSAIWPFWAGRAQALRIAAGALVLLTLAGLTWRQCGQYRDLETLWRTTLSRSPDSFLALNNLGEELLRQGRVAEAMPLLERTLQLKPESAQARCNLGVALLQRGQVEPALREFTLATQLQPELAEAHKNLSDVFILQGRMHDALLAAQRAVALDPNFAEAENDLGNALLNEGRVDEAIGHLQKALTLQPTFPNALNNMGVALIAKGRIPEATALFRRTVEILPQFAQAHHNLGRLELMQGHAHEAVARYELALKIQPDDPDTMSSLAWVLATWPDASIRNGAKAVELAQRANEITHGESPAILGTLAAAYAEAGRFADAVTAVQRALKLAEAQSNASMAELLRSQLKLHQSNAPLRDPSAPAAAQNPVTVNG